MEKTIKVMIIEDEAFIAMWLKRELESHGYEVCGTASNRIDALKIVDEHKPDLGIFDIYLRDNEDGISLAREIRKIHPIGLIFLTGYADSDVKENAKKLDPISFLVKPVSSEGFAVVLEKARAVLGAT
jgi:YesN/AraC family two-component response regulator